MIYFHLPCWCRHLCFGLLRFILPYLMFLRYLSEGKRERPSDKQNYRNIDVHD